MSNVNHQSSPSNVSLRTQPSPTASPVRSAAAVTPPPSTRARNEEAQPPPPKKAKTSAAVSYPEGSVPQLLMEGMQSDKEAVVLASVKALCDKVKALPLKGLLGVLDYAGHNFLVLCMTKWTDSGSIQSACIGAIGRIVVRCDNLKVNKAFVDRLIQCLHTLQTTQLIVAATKQFPNDETLQSSAVVALGNLMYGREPNDPLVVKGMEHCVIPVAQAMTRFATIEPLQAYSCWVLRRMADLGLAQQPSLLQGLTAAVAAVANHPNNKGMRPDVLALSNLVLKV